MQDIVEFIILLDRRRLSRQIKQIMKENSHNMNFMVKDLQNLQATLASQESLPDLDMLTIIQFFVYTKKITYMGNRWMYIFDFSTIYFMLFFI